MVNGDDATPFATSGLWKNEFERMAKESPEDLKDFLSKVDDIHRLVQKLSSNDENDVSKAMQESDVLLKAISKTGVDRTVINKAPASDKQQVAPNAFMAAIEKDANERAESRRQHKIVADEFKRKGNDAFHQQLYDEAIDFYTQGLQMKKDYDVLYTNRAQVHVKKEHYDKAIEDCDWALKVTPTLIKAHIIKGKCLMHLKAFDRAHDQFAQAEEIARKNFEPARMRRMIEDCVEEVQRQRDQHQREESARVFLANESTAQPINLTNTLKKLTSDGQPLIYYIGGIDLLCQLISDETTRTAFRVQHGFDLFNTHPVLSKTTHEQLAESMFKLMVNLSEDDDENTKQCLESQFLNHYLTNYLYSTALLRYLVDMSLKSQARSIIIQKLDLPKFLPCLIHIIDKPQSSPIDRLYATKLLSNLAVEDRVKHYFHQEPQLKNLISILTSSLLDEPTRTSMLSLLTNLCTEKQIRSCAMNQTDLLRILIDELKKPHEGKDERSTNLLGLLINLTNEANDTHHEFYKQLCETILTEWKDSSLGQRIFTLLGNIVMHYEPVVDVLHQHHIAAWIGRILEEDRTEETTRPGIKLLALYTRSNEQAQRAVASDHPLLRRVYEQFEKSEQSILIGNAALVFGHIVHDPSARTCLRNRPGVAQTIGRLLKLVEQSWSSPAARKNVAILITKLVKADESFLREFREQHGTEILHSALKGVPL